MVRNDHPFLLPVNFHRTKGFNPIHAQDHIKVMQGKNTQVRRESVLTNRSGSLRKNTLTVKHSPISNLNRNPRRQGPNARQLSSKAVAKKRARTARINQNHHVMALNRTVQFHNPRTNRPVNSISRNGQKQLIGGRRRVHDLIHHLKVKEFQKLLHKM